MIIRIVRIKVENFRGLSNASANFGEVNFLIGNNGTGKTTMLAVIARLMPVLRGEDRIFLDADFYFHDSIQTNQIKITYEIELIEKKCIQQIIIEVSGTRKNHGLNRSHLNDQISASIIVSIKDKNGNDKTDLIQQLKAKKCLKQKIIRHGGTGNRIAAISLKRDEKQMHAATSEREEQGDFDSLRARLLQLLLKSDLGKQVEQDYPNLLKNILTFTHKFLGERRFKDIAISHSEQLSLQRVDSTWEPWEGLSGGEQSAFNLAMAIEFERKEKSQIILFEEPENNLHPSIQKDFLKKIKTPLRGRQIFIATHSPYLFQDYLNESELIISKRRSRKISFKNAEKKFWLFKKPSWGEISYHAYGLLTFEFHNELYGWIQEKTQNWTEESIDKYFQHQGSMQNKSWIRLNKDGTQKTDNRTIMTYIRNFTHHPENTLNQKYSDKELHQSILAMMKIAKTLH